MVRFAVCDDEQKMVDCISDKLRAHYPDECKIKTYTDGASLLSDYRPDFFDALFLDIGMPELNGMEIAEKVRKSDRHVKIIFVSNQDDLAYKGYIYDAFRFVRKRNLDQELNEAVKSLVKSFLFANKHHAFKTSTGETVLAIKDIKYFKSVSHCINAVCVDGVVEVCGTLREYEYLMEKNGFIRIHKSYLVNYRHIRSFDQFFVHLKCGGKLPLSRNRINYTKDKMKFFQESQ